MTHQELCDAFTVFSARSIRIAPRSRTIRVERVPGTMRTYRNVDRTLMLQLQALLVRLGWTFKPGLRCGDTWSPQ